MARFNSKKPKRKTWDYKNNNIQEYLGTPTNNSKTQRKQPYLEHSLDEKIIVSGSEITPTQGKKLNDSYGQSRVSSVSPVGAGLGFYVDSTPGDPEENAYGGLGYSSGGLGYLSKKQVGYENHKARIIQDESVMIDLKEDTRSISSTEDVEILQAISHWGMGDAQRFHAQDYVTKEETDELDLLEHILFMDICLDPEEDAPPTDSSDEEDEARLPPSLSSGYAQIGANEKKKLAQQRRKDFKERMKANSTLQKYKKKFISMVITDFIRKEDLKSFQLFRVTPYGTQEALPAIAKAFAFELWAEHDTVTLTKTADTSRMFAQYTRNKRQVKGIRKADPSQLPKKPKLKKPGPDHGQVVGSEAQPIASNNIGHRMLAAMGWKEGDAIGGGIKEPIQAVKRAKNRGLGA